MDKNILQIILDNWKSVPLLLRLFVVALIISAIIFSVFLIPAKSSQEVQLISDIIGEDVKSNIIAFLEREKIPFSIRGGRIYVNSFDRDRVLMKLYTDSIIPEGPDLFKWVFEIDISETREKRNLRWHVTVQKRLEQLISRMENIEWAKVEFAPARVEPFFEDRAYEEPKASVLIKLKSDRPLNKKEVLGIAKFVSFAAGHINPKNITILDTRQRLYTVPDSQEALTSEQLEQKLVFEEAIEKKVYEFLSSFLTFVKVKASVEIDWKSRISKQTGVDPQRQIVVKEEKELKKEVGQIAGGQPGIISRLPVSEGADQPQPSPQPVTLQKESIERTSGYIETTENFPPGSIKNISLAVVVHKEEIIKVFADPKKTKKEDELLHLAQSQLIQTLSKGVNIPEDKIIVTAVNLIPSKEVVVVPPVEKVVEKPKVLAMPITFFIIVVLFVITLLIIVSYKKKAEIEKKREEIAKLMEKKEAVVEPPVAEEEPLLKEIKTIIKTNPHIATTIIRQWIKGK
ncbi:MAG: flagellar M-ring protein FliF C-terminal domain-containing protein [Planctomycetota bacterium]